MHNCDYKLNGIPVFKVKFNDFCYLMSLFKTNKRFLTRDISDQRIVQYVRENKRKSNCFYFEYENVRIDFRKLKEKYDDIDRENDVINL